MFFRLVEETFTVDEVSEVLNGLQAVVHSEVESELINTAYTNVLLLRQLFSQAEKWYLKLQTKGPQLILMCSQGCRTTVLPERLSDLTLSSMS